MTEVWAPIPSFPGYAVSNDGRVRGPRGMLSTPATSGGYLTCSLRREGHKVTTTVQRLVAEAFIGPAPSPQHEVNHKDGQKRRNTPDNLEWVTRQENMDHARAVLKAPMGRKRVERRPPDNLEFVGTIRISMPGLDVDWKLYRDKRDVRRWYAVDPLGVVQMHAAWPTMLRELAANRPQALGRRHLASY